MVEIGYAFQKLGITHIDLMMMNIEGYEYMLIPHMLSQDILPDRLIVQFHPQTIGDARTAMIYDLLDQHGYRIAWDYGIVLTAWERVRETPGYRTFVGAVRALPPDQVVYVRDFAAPFTAMTPARVLTDPEFVRYEGIKHAYPADSPSEGSQFAADLAALNLRRPTIWYVTRGEPVATVLWERA